VADQACDNLARKNAKPQQLPKHSHGQSTFCIKITIVCSNFSYWNVLTAKSRLCRISSVPDFSCSREHRSVFDTPPSLPCDQLVPEKIGKVMFYDLKGVLIPGYGIHISQNQKRKRSRQSCKRATRLQRCVLYSAMRRKNMFFRQKTDISSAFTVYVERKANHIPLLGPMCAARSSINRSSTCITVF